MAHSKCMTCRARVWRDGEPADLLGDLCPGCGGTLMAVGDISELAGLRSLRARPRSRDSSQVADAIRETIARHDAERARRLP